MPKVRAHITRYDVRYCGYRNRNSSVDFGSFEHEFSAFAQWIPGKALAETKTVEEVDGDPDARAVYSAGIAASAKHGCSALVLWNATPIDDDQISVIDGRSVVGKTPTLQATALDVNDIPGFPTYFLAFPKRSCIYAVRLEKGFNGIRNLRRMFLGFLERFTPRVAASLDSKGALVVDGFKDDAGTIHDGLRAAFEAHPHRAPSTLDQLLKLQPRIHRVIRKVDMKYVAPAHAMPFLKSLVSFLGGDGLQRSSKVQSQKITYSMQMKPTAADIRKVVNSIDVAEENTWDDIGFLVSGKGQQPIWVRKSLRSGDLNVDLDLKKAAFVMPEELLRAIEPFQSQLK